MRINTVCDKAAAIEEQRLFKFMVIHNYLAQFAFFTARLGTQCGCLEHTATMSSNFLIIALTSLIHPCMSLLEGRGGFQEIPLGPHHLISL